MKRLSILLILITNLCFSQLKQGIWRGTLLLNSETQLELPFNFEVKNIKNKYVLTIHNAQERIVVDEVQIKNDSLIFKMPIFDTEFITQIIADTLIKGVWINHTKKENNRVTFKAQYGNNRRFITNNIKTSNFYSGKWETTFSANTSDSSKAIGIFKYIKNSNLVEGTFLTETGDYRFLEGCDSMENYT